MRKCSIPAVHACLALAYAYMLVVQCVNFLAKLPAFSH